MARKPELKPNYSSSSDDEEEKEEEVTGSEDEQTSEEEVSGDSESDSEPKPKDEPKKQPASKAQPPLPSSSKPQPTVPSSSETEEESGSDSDSDSLPKSSADPNIKPISSKPIMEPEEVANAESKSAKKSIPAKGKRPPPAIEKEKVVKKAKNSDEQFKRVWSEEDEIIVLKGIIQCKTDDMGVVYQFIKDSLHVEELSRAKLVDKVRRMKKKYVNIANKEKKGKKGKKGFSNSHEQEGYELSKIIWGSETETEEGKNTQTQKNGGASSSTKKNGVGEKEALAMEVEKNMDVSQLVWYGGMSYSPVMEEEIVKAGLELVDGAKKEELNEKWKKFKLQEMQLYVQRIGLIKERAEIVLEAMLNSSGN